MRTIKNIGLICFFCLMTGKIDAQYLEVLADLDTNQIHIGEIFHLRLSVEQPAGMNVKFPPIRDTLIQKVEVLEHFPADTLAKEDVIKIEKQYSLTCFDSGLYVIPPLIFRFDSKDWSDTVSTRPLYLLVHTVAVDSNYFDIKSPIHVPVGFMEVFPYVAGGLVLLSVVVFGFWYLRKKRKGGSIFVPSRPEEPAHVIALRELNALREEKLWQKDEFKSYYSRLTEIIRRYMESRYSIPAMEMTSGEILRAWSLSGEDREDLAGNLNTLLNLADLVKFAREKPIASDNEINMERAYDFVHKTKIKKPLYGEEEESVTADVKSGDKIEDVKIAIENE